MGTPVDRPTERSTLLSVMRLQYIKAGYAGENIPQYTFPSVVGRPMLRAEEEVIGDVVLKVRSTVADRHSNIR